MLHGVPLVSVSRLASPRRIFCELMLALSPLLKGVLSPLRGG